MERKETLRITRYRKMYLYFAVIEIILALVLLSILAFTETSGVTNLGKTFLILLPSQFCILLGLLMIITGVSFRSKRFYFSAIARFLDEVEKIKKLDTTGTVSPGETRLFGLLYIIAGIVLLSFLI